jgi:hypothetical protein
MQTPAGIYGVDTVGKKIWKVSSDGFTIISLTERELDPIIGIRNVKTHYNKYK